MKKREIIEIYRALSGLKLNRFSDKDVRKNLFKNYIEIHTLVKDHDSKVEDLRKKYLEGLDEDINKVVELENEIQNCNDKEKLAELTKKRKSFKKVDEMVREFNKATSDLINEDIEINLVKLNKDKFIDDLSDDLTLAQTIALEPIFE